MIVNVEEKYYELTLKTLGVISSVSEFCPSAVCVGKSDDDNVINVNLLRILCENNKGLLVNSSER